MHVSGRNIVVPPPNFGGGGVRTPLPLPHIEACRMSS